MKVGKSAKWGGRRRNVRVGSKPCLLCCSLLAVETQTALTAAEPAQHSQCLHLLSQTVLVFLAAALALTVGKPVVGLASKETKGNPISGCCSAAPGLPQGKSLPLLCMAGSGLHCGSVEGEMSWLDA